MELVVPLVVVLDVVDGVLFVVVDLVVVVVGEVFDVVLVVEVDGFADVGVVFGGSRSGGFLIDKTVQIAMRRIKYFIFDNLYVENKILKTIW